MNKSEFEQMVYESYQLDWMISHGLSLKEYREALAEEEDIALDAGSYPEGNSLEMMESLHNEFEMERGFGEGTIWVCKDEFLNAEYLDPHYMAHLLSSLPNSMEKKAEWESYTGLRIPEETLEVSTTAGVIRATKSVDSGQPGICVMFQPAGYEDEIDAAFVSVMEYPGYRTDDHETPNDVILMTWGDPTTEDYTNKEIIRREDVIAGLGTGSLDSGESTQETVKKCYVPSLESVEVLENGDVITKDAWQDWGYSQNYQEAVDMAKAVKDGVDAGLYDDRKGKNEKLAVVLEVHDNESYNLLEIIELFDAK